MNLNENDSSNSNVSFDESRFQLNNVIENITVQEALQKWQNKEITLDQLTKTTWANNQKVHFWNPAEDEHPGSKDNNKSRTMLKYHYMHHPKGKFFQEAVKRGAIVGAIKMAHKWWLSKYDKDAFVYDDPRLAELDTFVTNYIKANVSKKMEGYWADYKLDILLKIKDLVIGMAKADIYYRTLMFDFVNTFCGKVVFELTEIEMRNLTKWHKGIGEPPKVVPL